MKWIPVTLGALALVGCMSAAAFSLGGIAWSRASERMRREMRDGAIRPPPVAPGDVSLPEPVARYLARSIPPGADPIGTARLQQEGEFRTGEGPEGWRTFTADQVVRTYPPAFLWDARISMAPLVTVRVRDGYGDGQGAMAAKVGGLIPVMDALPTPELARAALERYLAEAAWTPSRLLPGHGLTWEGADDSSAVATLTDRGLSVSVTVSFSADGDVVRVFVPDRGREVDGAYVPTPWLGRFWDHGPAPDGYRIPRQGEVAWVLDGDTVPYWRGRLTSVGYGRRPDA
ncbi:MAG TPA: DUF6544 family protein [Longimicrobiales bacterium]|nr:DUF6544 family protein [Longimicrobiales bacterium]